MITNGIGYDSWPIPSVKGMRATVPVLSRPPALALKPSLGCPGFRGHHDNDRAKQFPGVHYRPYAEHRGGAAMARHFTPEAHPDASAERIRSLAGEVAAP